MQTAGRHFRFPDFEELAAGLKHGAEQSLRYLLVVIGILALVIAWVWYGPAAMGWWKRRAQARKIGGGLSDPSDATILYRQMLDLLAKRGVEKPAWYTPVEFARVVKTPQMAPLVEEATAAYNELRYGGRREAAPRMLRVLEQIRQL